MQRSNPALMGKQSYAELLEKCSALEKELKELKEKTNSLDSYVYEQAFLLSPTAITVISKETVSLLVNDAFCKLTGYSREEVIGKTSNDLNLWIDSEERKEKFKSVLETGRLDGFEMEMRRKDNTFLHVRLTAKTITYKNQLCVLSIVEDINDLKQDVQKSEKREALLSAVIENMPFDFWMRDENGICVMQNQKSIDYWGNIIGKSLETYAIDENKDIWADNNRRAYNGEVVTEEVLLKNIQGEDRYYYNIIAPIINSDNKSLGILGFNLDITEQKESRIKLRKALADLRAMIENTDNYIMIADKFGRPISFNTNYKNMIKSVLGTEPVPGIKPHTLLHDDKENDYWEGLHKRVLSGEKFTEMYKLTTEGKDIHIELNYFPVVEEGEVIGFVESSRDVTSALEYQEELKKAKLKAEESDRLKSSFLANMSHEIRTPMNGIIGFAELLSYGNITEKERKEYIEIIYNNCNNLLNIVNNILDLSMIETNQVSINTKVFNLDELFKELHSFYHLTAMDKGIALNLDIDRKKELTFIKTDRTKLYQIINNLLSNSIKFTVKGAVNFGFAVEKDKLIITVKDTGPGIEKKKQDKIFNRFWKDEYTVDSNERGAGLGLAITKSLVELLNGKISVISKMNEGTTFVLEFEGLVLKNGHEA